MPAIVNGIDGDVIRVSAGETHTMALTLAGKVYGWGSYKDKEGKQWFTPPRHSSHIQRKQEEPLEIPGVSDAIDIVCGGNFNVVRCKNGDLLSWGLGEWGELCRPVCAMKRNRVYNEADILHDHLKPGQMFLESDEPAREARSVGAGTYHVLVVMGGGNSVYSSGLNNYGQLGLDLADREENRKKERLTLIEALEGEKVSHAAGGTHHSLVLTSTGSVFSFGRGDKGELGTGRRYKEGFFSTKPLLLRFPDSKGTPCAIACGANHNLVLTDRTEVYTWGFGDNSALGHGRDDDEVGPKTLKLKNRGQITDLGEVVQVAGGGQHSVILATMIANASSRYQYF
jgi:regulator of chromosome condensation